MPLHNTEVQQIINECIRNKIMWPSLRLCKNHNRRLTPDLVEKIDKECSFHIQQSASQKLKLLGLGISTSGNCCICGKSHLRVIRGSLSKYCGAKCQFGDPAHKEIINQLKKAKNPNHQQITNTIRKDTLLQKYGVTSLQKVPHVRMKREITNTERYGGISPFCDPRVRSKSPIDYSALVEKSKSGRIKKYGTDKLHEINRDKRDATNITRYGGICSLNGQHKEIQARLSQRLRIQFGVTNPAQLKNVESVRYLTDRDWLIEQHNIQRKSLTLIAQELDVCAETVRNHCTKLSIPIQRFPKSRSELEIFNFLRPLNITVQRNVRKIVPGELDIWVPNHKLAIELCGLYWHCDKHERMDSQYHYRKWKNCQDIGIQLLTIFEDEWLHKENLVKDWIIKQLRLGSVKNATDLVIKNVDAITANEFLAVNDLMEHTTCVEAEGLFDGPNIQCLKYNSDDGTQYCEIAGASIKEGPEKLNMSTFVVDNRWGGGNFHYIREHAPPRFDFVWKNKRHKCLPNSQTDVFRIWDCGHSLYTTKI